MNKVKNTLIAIVGGAVIMGTIVVFNTAKPCGIELYDVNKDNLIEKMVEKIEDIEIQSKKYIYGCDLEKVRFKKDGVQFSDRNCKEKNENQWKDFREENLDKIKRLNDFEYNEINQIRKNFEDIWNYHLFEKCGLVEE